MRNWLLLLVLAAALSSPASAHNIVIAVWPAGDVIEGEIGFSSGELARPGTQVRVLGPDGEELGTTRVGEDGLFRFEPSTPVPHRFVADLGQGHVAETTLAVDELPATVTASAGGAREAQAAPATATAAGAATAAAGAAIDAERLETLVAAAVQRELAPLKRQLAAREQEADLQGLIGGIGYICGIFGLLFFVYARRRA